jgi:hypothetical protein
MSGRPTQPQGSLFAAIMGTIASREPADRQKVVELLLGFVAFFALVTLVRTAAATVHGAPSAPDALVAAMFVGLGYLLLRRWRALDRRMTDDAARSRGAG